tara:strand:- start:1019 stop:1285 length:267 start_codon:yes stop_codon:yes gene_type:complete
MGEFKLVKSVERCITEYSDYLEVEYKGKIVKMRFDMDSESGLKDCDIDLDNVFVVGGVIDDDGDFDDDKMERLLDFYYGLKDDDIVVM